MWPQTFNQRLSNWHALRDSAETFPIDQALQAINTWWQHAPWRPYYLHWDDRPRWPDPWQLLSDDIYCDLAKGLGILYTISMLNREDMADATLVLTDQGHNLVQVAKRKYILNWGADIVVNNNPAVKIIKQYQLLQARQQYN